MNEAATARRSDIELHLETEFLLDLDDLAHARTTYSIEQLISVLELTATLTALTVGFDNYVPTNQNNRRIVEPLCRCLSNLRCRNEHHPLRDLTLYSADLRIRGMLHVFQQVLMAATKYGGICHVKLMNHVYFLPIQFLVEFCHNNNNLKVLEMAGVSFTDGGAAMSLPPNRTQDSSVMLALDKLSLSFVYFENSTAATSFANFIARMTVRALVLGKIRASGSNDEIIDRILSEIKMPSVKQLALDGLCRVEHFKAALEAGTTSLTTLGVRINYHKSHCMEKLEWLTNFFRRAVQLNSLKIHSLAYWKRPTPPPPELLLAIEACATITEIEASMNGRRRFAAQSLEGITARNEELASFIVSPSTYPIDKLLGLMRQFENCPTGRYLLARSLPVVLSFETIKSTVSPTTESKQKKRKTE